MHGNYCYWSLNSSTLTWEIARYLLYVVCLSPSNVFYFFCRLDVQVEPHQTRRSVTKSDFPPPSFLQVYPQNFSRSDLTFWKDVMSFSIVCQSQQCVSVLVFEGTEARPDLCSLSSRETGFTRGAMAPLACPVSTDPLLLPVTCSRFESPLTSVPLLF